VAISRTIPAISHVAVTVTDLSVSEPWYTRVFGVEPVLDEEPTPGLDHVSFGPGPSFPQARLRAVNRRYSHAMAMLPVALTVPWRRARPASSASSAAVRSASAAMVR